MITLQEHNGFSEKLIADLKILVEHCKTADRSIPMIYWDVLKSKREAPGDYCLYQYDKMIGYLSTFSFEESLFEVSFAIHPDFRNQSLFEELFDYARDRLQTLQYTALLLSTGTKDTSLTNTFTQLGAKITHKEYILRRDNIAAEEICASDPIELVQGEKEDAFRFAEVHARCFGSELDLMEERFSKTIGMPNRRCFLAQHHGHVIGALHVRIDSGHSACFHDVSIIPEKQNFGFGLQLLRLALNTLIAEGQKQFHILVAAENKRALRLYERCHFTETQSYQFWRMDKHFIFPPHYTIPKRKH